MSLSMTLKDVRGKLQLGHVSGQIKICKIFANPNQCPGPLSLDFCFWRSESISVVGCRVTLPWLSTALGLQTA